MGYIITEKNMEMGMGQNYEAPKVDAASGKA